MFFEPRSHKDTGIFAFYSIVNQFFGNMLLRETCVSHCLFGSQLFKNRKFNEVLADKPFVFSEIAMIIFDK